MWLFLRVCSVKAVGAGWSCVCVCVCPIDTLSHHKSLLALTYADWMLTAAKEFTLLGRTQHTSLCFYGEALKKTARLVDLVGQRTQKDGVGVEDTSMRRTSEWNARCLKDFKMNAWRIIWLIAAELYMWTVRGFSVKPVKDVSKWNPLNIKGLFIHPLMVASTWNRWNVVE